MINIDSSLIGELFSILMAFLDQGLLTWIPAIIGFGLFLKCVAKVKGYALPFIVCLTGVIVAIIHGICVNGYYHLIQLIGYGFGQGLTISFIAISIYDICKAFKAVIALLIEKLSSERAKKVDAEEPLKVEEKAELNQAING